MQAHFVVCGKANYQHAGEFAISGKPNQQGTGELAISVKVNHEVASGLAISDRVKVGSIRDLQYSYKLGDEEVEDFVGD